MGVKVKEMWPVPNSYSKQLPSSGQPGSFWENRGDRYHCGADIYAPADSIVLTILTGKVLQTGIFTHPDRIHYWNRTFYVIVESETGYFVKYAELGSIDVKLGEEIKSGEKIGMIGQVLNPDLVTEKDPLYIQALKNNSNDAMLHLEAYEDYYCEYDEYLGGNLFTTKRPDNLISPAQIIHS